MDHDGKLVQLNSLVEEELISLIRTREPALYRLLEYQFAWIDQHSNPHLAAPPLRRHALFCLATSQLFRDDAGSVLPAAAAIELAHQFSLVHDDIQEGNPERDGRATVWWIWGPAQGINAGDGLYAMARIALVRLREIGVPENTILQALQILEESCLNLFEGQHQDIAFAEKFRVTQKDYLTMAEKRSGALFGAAGQIGALLGGGSQEEIDICRLAGQKLGLGVHLREDIQAFWSELDNRLPDSSVLNKKKSLPLILALEYGDAKAKRELQSVYLKRVLEPTDLPKLTELLETTDARRICEEVSTAAISEGLELISSIGDNERNSSHIETFSRIVFGN